MFGPEMRLPVDAIVGNPSGSEGIQDAKSFPEYVAKQKKEIQKTEELAREYLQDSQKHQKDVYDVGSPAKNSHKIGDLVMLHNFVRPKMPSKKFSDSGRAHGKL